MKVYIAGKITGFDGYRERFAEVEARLLKDGHVVMNPARMNDGFEHPEYMSICLAMIDVCECVYMMDNYHDSVGARMEHQYALNSNKRVVYESVEAK